MSKSYDVVVVGGNVAGSSVSYNLAKCGLKVAMLELLASDRIGAFSCGDGLDVHEFKRLGLKVPTGEFVHGDVIQGEVIAPNGVDSLAAQGKIKAVHRYHFCQHLKDQALNAGAEIIAPARAIAPIIKNDFVVGLKYRPITTSKDKALKKMTKGVQPIRSLDSKVLVDASGLNAVIRRQLPASWWVTESVEKKDIAVCYKESRKFDKPLPKKFIQGFISSEVAPGGFYWLATRSNTLINVGLGINMRYMPLSPKQQLYNEILPRHPILKRTTVLWRGGGQVPRRWPLGCMIGNGFIAAGDAAAMVNPMSGGGIGPSVYSGLLAGKVIPQAIENNNCSIESLWDYNFEYNTNYGPVQAGNYILRTTLEGMADAQVNALLGAKLFSKKEIITIIETGKLELGFTTKLKKLSKLAKHPRLLLKLRSLYKNMEHARQFYREYPSTCSEFVVWQKRVNKFFNKI